MRRDKKTYSILVVEDNPGDFFLIQDYLEDEMLAPEINNVTTFQEAKTTLDNSDNIFDVVLLDLSLPDKKGEDLIYEVLSISHDVPVIILTGYVDVNFAVKALNLGACDYLLKDNLNATVLYKSIVYNIERNKNLVRLKESEHRYSELFHLSPQPMWVYDLESLQFLDVNDAAIKNYGYSFEEFMQMTIREIRPQSEIEEMEKGVAISRLMGNRFSHKEYYHQKKNGEVIIVDLRSNIISYNNKKAEIVLASDITERVQHIKAIEEQNKKLSEIAWTQSHLVRAPLARIMGLIEIINYPATTNKEKEEMLNYIVESAEELDQIIRKIVNRSREEI